MAPCPLFINRGVGVKENESALCFPPLVQQEAAECQAAERSTAARPCAEKVLMNNAEFPRAFSGSHPLLFVPP